MKIIETPNFKICAEIEFDPYLVRSISVHLKQSDQFGNVFFRHTLDADYILMAMKELVERSEK